MPAPSPSPYGTLMDQVSRAVFAIASITLMMLAAILTLYGAYQVVVAFRSAEEAGQGLLDAVGYVVIAIAVFDVGKYLLEEEVLRGREMRITSEARRSLTKFISTIAIAVFLEALVTVFQVSKENVALMLYPTLLLVAGTVLVLGLGLYQRLSASVEREVGEVSAPEEAPP